MLDYCGLPFEPQCLSFHRTRPAVQTLSNRRVRRAPYSGSSEAWKADRAHLGILLAALKSN